MVQPSWFKGKNYVKHERWVELWRDCLRVNYERISIFGQ
nr:protein rep [Shigella sonnei]